MDYTLQEGTLTLPDNWSDSTVNVMQAKTADAMTLVINRDEVPKGEDPQVYAAAQWGVLVDELNNFKRLDEITLKNPAFASNMLEYRWENEQGMMYQMNALRLEDRQLMSFTFTVAAPFSEVQRQQCLAILNSYAPKPPADAAAA